MKPWLRPFPEFYHCVPCWKAFFIDRDKHIKALTEKEMRKRMVDLHWIIVKHHWTELREEFLFTVWPKSPSFSCPGLKLLQVMLLPWLSVYEISDQDMLFNHTSNAHMTDLEKSINSNKLFTSGALVSSMDRDNNAAVKPIYWKSLLTSRFTFNTFFFYRIEALRNCSNCINFLHEDKLCLPK